MLHAVASDARSSGWIGGVYGNVSLPSEPFASKQNHLVTIVHRQPSTTRQRNSAVKADSTKPEDTFYLAVGYRFSAQILWAQIQSIYGPANVVGLLAEHFPPTAISAIVLECLSIELYLKCLIQVEQQLPTTPRGHGLIDLFKQLSQEKQGRIEALFDSKEPPSSEVAYWSFAKVLTSLNDAFVSWRYAHEYGMKQTTFDTRLAISIQEAVLEHIPTWRHLIEFKTILPTPS